MSKPKKPAWIDEFVAFAVKGNAMALAVGTIIGAAFSTITKSLTEDIIMPIDNDLSGTDHCPGYGSAAKYIATSCMELYQDARVYDTGTVVIVEIMGRHAGWLAGAAGLASWAGSGPDLVYLPDADGNAVTDANGKAQTTKTTYEGTVTGVSISDGYPSVIAKDTDGTTHKVVISDITRVGDGSTNSTAAS